MNARTQSIFEIKQANRKRIFDLILQSGKISRQSIATQLGLSLPTVNQYLEQLFEGGLIRENGQIPTNSVGRKARAISINATARIALGMDITQQSVSLVAVDLCGHILKSLHLPYTFRDTPECYRFLGQQIIDFIADRGWKQEILLGLGISLPAIVTQNGTGIGVALLIDDPRDFYAKFSAYCQLPYRLYNDANAGGFSEIYMRKSIRRMVYLSLCHSIGGAIIEDNQIVNGDNWCAGEFGHMTLVPNGLVCHCGRRGCANSYCSPDVLAAHAGGDLNLFFQRLEEGDAECAAAFDEYLEYLSILLHNIRTCFDCDIIMGGTMGQYIPRYIDRLNRMVHERAHYQAPYKEFLRPGYYPYDAASIGAALFFVDDFIQSI